MDELADLLGQFGLTLDARTTDALAAMLSQSDYPMNATTTNGPAAGAQPTLFPNPVANNFFELTSSSFLIWSRDRLSRL